MEYDGANTLQARYTHGPGIDEPIAVTKGANTYFYHQDGLGSVTDLTDSAGATAKSYSYDAYGTILESPGTVDQPYTYTGREFDAETGLYYYRARYYDAMTGRFLQNDPIGFRGGDVNLFSYVRNNPSNFIDPKGTIAFLPVLPFIPPLVEAGINAGVIVGGLVGGAAIGDYIFDHIFRQKETKPADNSGAQVGSGERVISKPCPPDDPCDKKVSNQEIRRLQKGKINIHELKSGFGAPPSRFDLFKCRNGDIVIKRKGSKDIVEYTDFNINSF